MIPPALECIAVRALYNTASPECLDSVSVFTMAVTSYCIRSIHQVGHAAEYAEITPLLVAGRPFFKATPDI